MLTAGVKRCYAVAAINSFGESAKSSAVCGVPVSAASSAITSVIPDGLQVHTRVATKRVGLTWDVPLIGTGNGFYSPTFFNICYGETEVMDRCYGADAAYFNMESNADHVLDPAKTYIFKVSFYTLEGELYDYPLVAVTPSYRFPAPQNIIITEGAVSTDGKTQSVTISWTTTAAGSPQYGLDYGVGLPPHTEYVMWGAGPFLTGEMHSLSCGKTYQLAVANCSSEWSRACVGGCGPGNICDTYQTPSAPVTFTPCSGAAGFPYQGVLDAIAYCPQFNLTYTGVFSIDGSGNITGTVGGASWSGTVSATGAVNAVAAYSNGTNDSYTGQLTTYSSGAAAGTGTYTATNSFGDTCTGTWSGTWR
jgi:hypothetical protein